MLHRMDEDDNDGDVEDGGGRQSIRVDPAQTGTKVGFVVDGLPRPTAGGEEEPDTGLSLRAAVVGDVDALQDVGSDVDADLVGDLAQRTVDHRFAGLQVAAGNAQFPVAEPSVSAFHQQDVSGDGIAEQDADVDDGASTLNHRPRIATGRVADSGRVS